MPDLSTRPATLADAAAIHRLIGKPFVSLDTVSSDLARPAIDLARDTLLTHTPDGELVGWAWVHLGRRAEAHVHAAHRGRGLGSRLLAFTEANARAAGSDRLGQNVDDADPAAAQLLTAHGYQLKATSWLLHLALPDEPAVPDPPAGLSVRAYRDGDGPAVHELVEDSFAAFRSRRRDYAEWAQHIVQRATFAPHLSCLAFDGERLVGVQLSLDLPDTSQGHIAELAVHSDYRGRDVGAFLLRQAFSDVYRHGRRGCEVWTHSDTGALGFYQRAGMSVTRSGSHYSKAL
ncbi:GNAT family N-acetyltransferase [Rhizocola hellebori]|uniref:GNAT family N-acetyltransferase n=1 Tax=Rhizocola hellebori TaxID=1392758 RepID=UPI0019403CF0|nr:GNAT family N-acetyltransferase [Rhizocola hellebori]